MVPLTALIAALASIAPPGGEEMTPGVHKRLPCDGNPTWTWDVYVPKAYAEQGDRKFPVVWCSSAQANPGFWHLEGWGEKNGVLLIAINDTRNGQTFDEIAKIQDSVIATAEKKLRLHPCLRFSTGHSGGAWMSQGLASRYGDRHAGIVMQSHSGTFPVAKHISVVFIHGTDDNVHPFAMAKAAYENLKQRGNPVRLLAIPGRGHGVATIEELTENLDWMFQWQRLTHPHLPPVEKEAAKKEVRERSAACGKIEDPAARRAEAELLMGLPGMDRAPECRALALAWFTARAKQIEAVADPVARHEEYFTLASHERSRLVPPEESQKVSKLIEELRKDKAVQGEWEALKRHAAAMKQEEAAGGKRAQLRPVMELYAAIARKYPDTRAGKRAAEDAQRLEKILQGNR